MKVAVRYPVNTMVDAVDVNRIVADAEKRIEALEAENARLRTIFEGFRQADPVIAATIKDIEDATGHKI